MARDEVKLSPLILGCVFKTSKLQKHNTLQNGKKKTNENPAHNNSYHSQNRKKKTRLFSTTVCDWQKHIRGRQYVVWGATASSIIPLFDKIQFSNLWSQTFILSHFLQHCLFACLQQYSNFPDN
jgi:hypothetical protein